MYRYRKQINHTRVSNQNIRVATFKMKTNSLFSFHFPTHISKNTNLHKPLPSVTHICY